VTERELWVSFELLCMSEDTLEKAITAFRNKYPDLPDQTIKGLIFKYNARYSPEAVAEPVDETLFQPVAPDAWIDEVLPPTPTAAPKFQVVLPQAIRDAQAKQTASECSCEEHRKHTPKST
jgi:hypothetical protein